jgi:choline monooxygenase
MAMLTNRAAFDPTLPLERARTIPSEWYTDAAVAAVEARSVFRATWQAVGRLDQLTDRGSFLTADLAGLPVLVVRDNEGTLRAFHNVCRHRGAVLAAEATGKLSRLRCRYHGWTYDLTGRLRGAPEFDGVADFCKEDQGLPPVHVDTWGPVVWVHAGTPQESLHDYLRPLPEQTAALGLDALRFVQRREFSLACNWKVFVDNYLDGGYHVNTVHPELASVLNYADYRTDIHEFSSVQSSPLQPPDDPALRSLRTGNRAYYWWVYPNVMLNIYQGVMDTNLVLPCGPDRCRVIFDYYFARPDGQDRQRFEAESIALADRIQEQDIGICEEVQRGLASGSFASGRYCVKREAGVYHFHQLLARQLS